MKNQRRVRIKTSFTDGIYREKISEQVNFSRTSFAHDLTRFGPQRSYAPVSRAVARAYCARLARTHYENFSVASLLLPRRLLPHFHHIYAYCRWADDLADETVGGAAALRLLRWWRDELLECYGGRPHHPVMVALAETIRDFRIPPDPFLQLLFAFEQDQLLKDYQTIAQLLDYCRYSANPVGHLVLYLCRSFDARRAGLADHVCTALQLTNFWQDVARDYAIGRVYLPEEDRRRFGYSADDLQARRYNHNFADLLAYLVERTRDLFYRGYPLVDQMPADVRPDIELFLRGGLAILRKIERQHYNVWDRRPVLGKWEKLLLVGKVFCRRLPGLVW
jgi:squalene synthase HpnC